MIRAGLTGTNWTGKTETIKKFIEEHSELSIRTVSLSSLVKRCPYPMMENQTIEASRWIIKQVKDICKNNSVEMELFDRTPIDILAFTLYAEDHTGHCDPTVRKNALKLMESFDMTFYLPPSTEWPVNVYPSDNKIEFAKLMDAYMLKTIEYFKLDVIQIPWDFTKRQNILCQHLLGVSTI